MDEKEAELIGAHVGDGTLYLANKTTIVWELRGSVNEQEYYVHISDIIKEILDVEVKPKYRGINSYGIQTTNKIITSFFVNNGFKPGKKVYTVRVPEYIKSGNLEIKRAFIRGLFDTDGCIRFDKNGTSYHYYPKIEFSFASVDLVSDLKDLFTVLGFTHHSWQNNNAWSICLSGFGSLKKWIDEIKPANSKHLHRISSGLINKDKIVLKKVSKSVNFEDRVQIFKSL